MTNFLRYAYLSLVAYAAAALILMIALAAHAEDAKPSAETKDGTRQIVVEEPKGKDATPAPEKITLAKGEDTAAVKPADGKPVVEAVSNDTPAESAAPAPEAPAEEAAPAPQPEAAPLPKPKAYVVYVRPYHTRYGYRHSAGYHHCD
jgi:hypothetical protein